MSLNIFGELDQMVDGEYGTLQEDITDWLVFGLVQGCDQQLGELRVGGVEGLQFGLFEVGE